MEARAFAANYLVIGFAEEVELVLVEFVGLDDGETESGGVEPSWTTRATASQYSLTFFKLQFQFRRIRQGDGILP